MSFTFLNPWGWFFLGLAPVLVLLYLRRARRRTMEVSTLMFWQRALGESLHRAWFGRLRQWFSLLLHLLILALGVLALVRPEPKNGARIAPVAQSTVIVLDARARMQAVELDGENRFSKALKLVRQAVATAREGSSIAVLVARPAPEVISPFCTDPAVLSTRLTGLTATDAGGDLSPTLALAHDLARASTGKCRIVLVTDGSEPAATGMEVVGVGSALDNVAITRFAARPRIASPQTADLLLEVANFGKSSIHGNVEISSDGALLDVKPFELAPGARKSEIFSSVPRAGSGKLTARLDVPDALAFDNTSYTLLPTGEPCRVLLVSAGNWFLEKLLASDSTVRFEMLAPGAFQPAMSRNFDAVIFDRCSAASGAKDIDGVTGNALFIKSSPLGSNGVTEQPPISDTDADSPLLRFVQWRDVTFLRADRIAVPERAGWTFQTPLRSVDLPLIVAGTRLSTGAEQRVAVFAFDVADTDLPLHIGYPLLISNTVHWLAQTVSEAPEAAVCGRAINLGSGESARAEPDHAGKEAGSEAASHPEPTQADRGAPATAVSAVKGALQPLRNGFYRIDNTEATAESHRWVAVNTGDDGESNLRANATKNAAPRPVTFPLLAAAIHGALWTWLALAAFVLLTAEWWLFHRRRTE